LGKTCYSAPIIGIFFLKKLIQLEKYIIWFNLIFFLKKHGFKKTAILNYDFNIKGMENHSSGSVYCFGQHNWHAAM
jgi:hypothetical protein